MVATAFGSPPQTCRGPGARVGRADRLSPLARKETRPGQAVSRRAEPAARVDAKFTCRPTPARSTDRKLRCRRRRRPSLALEYRTVDASGTQKPRISARFLILGVVSDGSQRSQNGC